MKKLFTNDKFFLACVIIAVALGVSETITSFAFGIFGLEIFAQGLILHCCTLFLFISYKKHSKNVMKGILGAALMAYLLQSISFISSLGSQELPFSIIYFVLMGFLFINHFIINSNHHSSSAMIRINQIIAILIFVLNTTWDVWRFCSYTDTVAIVCNVMNIFGFPSVICVIVCIESRLDAYRLDREAAGWTEEAGYPEGYVHEYQKRK